MPLGGSNLLLAQASELPSWLQIARTLTLQAGYNTTVVILSATLLGIAAGIIGTFALLRKRSMMGDALAHCTLPGIAMAFLLATALGASGRSLPVLLTGAAITGVLGILAVQAIVRWTRLREDAAIAISLGVFFGFGIVLLSYIQTLRTGTQGGLAHFIYGQTAAMQAHDAMLMACSAALAALAALLFYKEFRLVCFDDRFAASVGIPVGFIDLLMMALVVLVTVIGLQAVGLLLIVAMLIIPPAAARFWTERFGLMIVLSACLGGLSGYLGATLSALLPRTPAGAVIVLTAGALFLTSMLAAPRRGVLVAILRHAKLRLHIARDHFLRAAYESLELHPAGAEAAAVPLSAITSQRHYPPLLTAALLRLFALQRLITLRDRQISLTPRGLAEAARITRNHRLWEEFLVTHADIAASHVDRTADMVEHILSPELVRKLEAVLTARGELPRIPPSVHPLTQHDT